MAEPSKFYVGSSQVGADRVERYALDSSASVRFIGEQDGTTERDFKRRLLPILAQHPAVDLAYLARVQYAGENHWSIALCLRFGPGVEDRAAIFAALPVFAAMFDRAEHLDAITLNDDQWERLRIVCKPFYVRAGTER